MDQHHQQGFFSEILNKSQRSAASVPGGISGEDDPDRKHQTDRHRRKPVGENPGEEFEPEPAQAGRNTARQRQNR